MAILSALRANSVTSVLVVPHDYSSGTLLSDTTTFLDASFASLGLTPGTYVYGWGSGADADTFTIDIGAVPEPSTWALLLLGFGGLGFAGYKRARGQQSPLA